MKKGLVITLSAALCLSPYISSLTSIPVAAVSASMDAGTFIETYGGVTVTTANGQQTGTTFSWFRVAAPSNAALIVKGYEVYQTLPPAVKAEISASYRQQKINYEALAAQARAIVQADTAAPAEQSPASGSYTAEAPEQADAEKVEQPSAPVEGNTIEDLTGQTPAAQPAKTPAGAQSAQNDQSPAQQSSDTTAEQKNETDLSSAPQAEQPAAQPVQNSAAKAPASTPYVQKSDVQKSENSSTGSAPAASSPQKPEADSAPVQTPETPAEQKQNADGKPSASVQEPEESTEDSSAEDGTVSDPSEKAGPDSDSSVPDTEQEVLFTDSLQVGQGADAQTVALQISGDPAAFDAGETEAIQAYMQKIGLPSYTLYNNVIYKAAEGDHTAVSSSMAAARSNGTLVLFTISYNESTQSYELIQYSVDSISFDFITGVLHPIVKDTYTYKYMQVPDTPDQPAEPDRPENPDTPESPDTPDTPENPSSPDLPDQPETPEQPAVPDTPAETPQKPSGSGQSTPVQKPAVPSTGIQSSPSGPQHTDAETAGGYSAVQNSTAASQAAGFIRNYCSDSAGRVYSAANVYNYRQILNGYSSWKKLSASVRNVINEQLKASAGQTFASLFTQANRVRLGLVQGGGAASTPAVRPSTGSSMPYVTSSPQTSKSSMAPLYIFLMMMSSLGFFVSLLRKKDII